MTTTDQIRTLLPTEPTFHLTIEPWIDVTDPDRSNPRTISLTELLTSAHTVQLDESARGPLWRHAMERLLIAYAHILHAIAPTHPWQDVSTSNAALPAAAITQLLQRFSDRLWLHHPTTPFMQDLSVLDAMNVGPDALHPFWSLLPEVPSKSNTAWFGRQANMHPPSKADAANALLIRHVFALPGIEMTNKLASTTRSDGGATALTKHGRSYITMAGRTVAETMARNLMSTWIAAVTPASPTFFEMPHDPATALATGNVLWTYTASCAATVLLPSDTLDVYGVIRTPAPLSKTVTKLVRAQINAGDPHTLRTDPATSSSAPHRYRWLPVHTGEIDLIRQFYGQVGNCYELHPPSLIRPRATPYRTRSAARLNVLSIDGAGTSNAPRIGGAGTLTPAADALELDPDRAGRFTEIANTIVGSAPSVSAAIHTAVCTVMRADNKAQRTPIYDAARDAMVSDAADILIGLLSTCQTVPIADLPTGVTDPQVAQLVTSALDTFDRLTAGVSGHPGHARDLVIQRQRLPRRIRTVLGAPT